MDVLNDVVQVPKCIFIFGYIPAIKKIVSKKFPDEFKFQHEDLEAQSEDVL